MKIINKFESLSQQFRYSRFYRSPKWIYKKIKNRKINHNSIYEVKMRIGHRLQLRPTQNYLRAVIYSGQYHDENVFVLSKILKQNSVVLDIGANIGLYSCAIAQYFKKLNLKIFAIEAVENNVVLLKKNIENNRFKNIDVFNIALGKEKGELIFELPDKDFVGNAASTNISGSTQDTFKTVVGMDTLDNFILENSITHCDFVKIDIEGAEYFVFEGGKKFINKCRPVIQAEYNRHWVEKLGFNFLSFVELFSEYDYVYAIEKGKNKLRIIENPKIFIIEEALVDIYFIPKEKLPHLLNS